MADILIRGMEMPKTCCQCDLKIYDDDIRWDENGIEQIGAWVCKRTGEIIWNTQRGENCPLVPLPAGHGRLGDLDALSESLAESATFNYNKRTSVTWADAFESMIDILEEADTIVPVDVTDIDVGSKKEGGGEDG